MSTTTPDEKSGSRFPFLALLAAAGWAGSLALLWYLKPAEGETPQNWWIFLGRFHPLIVHVPIGLLLIVPVVEFLGRFGGKRQLLDSVPLLLWLTALGTVGATVIGYLLMEGEQIESDLMDKHLWSGLIFGALAFLTLGLRQLGWTWLYLPCLGAAVLVLSAAGHYGGALVHGPAYLAKYAPEPLKPLMMAGLEDPAAKSANGNGGHAPADPNGGETPTAAPEIPLADRVVYTDFVAPILEAKCNECHNEAKTKGKLRLDAHDLIIAGADGSDYATVTPGNSEESELIVRVLLPMDDDEFMPPDGKDPFTAEEIKVLRWWIDKGASKDATVSALASDDDLNMTLLAVGASLAGDKATAAAIAGSAGLLSEWDVLSTEVKQERLDALKAAAEQYHFTVTPVSAEDDRLKVNVINAAKEFGDQQLALLEPVAERIVWLDLAKSQVTDAGMKSVAKMRNLEQLHLENTKVGDAGVAELSKLVNLEYLNLYGTAVTSAVFKSLGDLKSLRKLYLWETKVDQASARAFQRSMSLEVNVGTPLQAPPKPGPAKPITVDPKKAEPKKEEPKKVEPKKEAPKPAPVPPPAAPTAKAPTPATPPAAEPAKAKL
jgi:uncharacterized membrane protein